MRESIHVIEILESENDIKYLKLLHNSKSDLTAKQIKKLEEMLKNEI